MGVGPILSILMIFMVAIELAITPAAAQSGGTSLTKGQKTMIAATGRSITSAGTNTSDGSKTSGPTSTAGGTGGSTTTTGPTTSGGTAAPSPVVVLTATLEEAFVDELNNRSSVQYRDLETRVETAFDSIFSERFGLLFIRTFVIGFRPQRGNIHAELGLQFNNVASPDQIPQADAVADTLISALNNPNNTFGLAVDPTSIQVIRLTTTNGAMTTSGGSTVDAVSITSRPPLTTVASVTPSGSTRTSGSTTTGGLTITSGSTSTNGSTTTGASIITDGSPTTGRSTTAASSVTTDGSVTSQETTSPVGLGGAVTTAAPFVVVLTANLEEPFVEELKNPSSIQYRALERRVVTACDLIYRARFGFLFIRTFVIRFSRVVARTRMENTNAEVGLEFNNTASQDQIPQDDVVVDTLVQALSNPNNTFNLTVDTNTIEIIRTPNTTLSSPTTATNSNTTSTPPKTAAPATTTTATPVTTATTAAMTVSVTAVATTTVQFIKRKLTFRSAGETFTNDLLNPSSFAFVNRAEMIKMMLEPFYQRAFSSFRSLAVISFSNGSIINTVDLSFASTSVPSNTQIADVLAGAASNITAFNIDTTSFFVDGTHVSSGVSHKTSLITAFFLVLLSWLLSSQQ